MISVIYRETEHTWAEKMMMVNEMTRVDPKAMTTELVL